MAACDRCPSGKLRYEAIAGRHELLILVSAVDYIVSLQQIAAERLVR